MGYAEYKLWLGIVVQLTYTMSLAAALIFLTLTTCSDPGIVPRERKTNLPYKKPAVGDLEKKDDE